MKKTRKSAPRNQIGARIRQARLRCKPAVSQEDLVGRVAVQGVVLDCSVVSRIESQDRYLMDDKISVIAKALRVSIAWLFGEKE